MTRNLRVAILAALQDTQKMQYNELGSDLDTLRPRD